MPATTPPPAGGLADAGSAPAEPQAPARLGEAGTGTAVLSPHAGDEHGFVVVDLADA